jgi:predicted negative regulator of RcsB-dependent stress response
MSIYLSDKEQIDVIKGWWKEYGTTILLGLAVFFVGSFGWQYWQKISLQNKAYASLLYVQMVNAYNKGEIDNFKAMANNLKSNYSRSPYASFGSMLLAKEAVKANHWDEALDDLGWVTKHSKSVYLSQMARVRSARILVAQDRPKAALDMLAAGQQGYYSSAVDEIAGNAWLAQKDEVNAAKSYAQALEDSKDPRLASPLLGARAEQLGVTLN